MRRRLPWLVALALLVPAVVHGATIVNQNWDESGACTTPCTIAFSSNVTTGNAVIVRASCVNGCNFHTFAASDATNGAYTKDIENSVSVASTALLSKRNVTGGFTTVTLTVTGGGTPTILWYIDEVSGLSTAGTVLTGMNTATGTSNNCSTSGLTGSGFSVCIAAVNNNPVFTAGTGWTAWASGSLFEFTQHRITAISSNQGPWTAASSVNYWSVMAMYPDATAAAGGCRAALSLLGVGGC